MIDRFVSRDELQRLLSALLVVMGFIGLAALFGFIIVPGLRYQAHTSQESPVVAVQGESGWLDPTDYPSAAREVIPPIDPKTVMTPNPELLARGQKLFAETCATCHGTEGKGDGPGAKGLTPVPRNFTVGGWKNGSRIEDIYRTLEEGVKGSSMVSYSYLSKKDRMALVHVVQSLGTFDHGSSDPTVDHGSSDPTALAALEKLFASAGEVIPSRIPVKNAVERLVAEFRAIPAISPSSGNPLVREAVLDASRAAQTLAGVSGWQASDQALAKGILPGLPGNGFAPALATYTPAQWKELRLALSQN